MNSSLLSFKQRTASAIRLGVATAVALSSSAFAAQIYDFNSSSQLSDGFYTSGTPVFSHSSSGGISNTGWLTTASGTSNSARSSLVVNDTFAGNTSEFTLSINFKWQTANLTSGDLLVVGFGTSTNPDTRFDPVFGANGVAVGPASAQEFHLGIGATSTANVVRISGSMLVNGVIENFTSGSSSVTLSNGNWYSLSVKFTLNDLETGYLAEASLLNSNSDGVPGSELLSWSTTKLNTSLVGNDVHAFVASRYAHYSGVTGVDNFIVTAMVPEPSTITACAVGLGMLAFSLRRKGKTV